MNNKMNLASKIGIFTTALAATASAIYLYSPVIKTHADSSAEADINLSVSDVIAITLDKGALNIVADVNSFASGTINAIVSTNSAYGYTLTLEDKDAVSNLVHSNENVSTALTSSFMGPLTSSEMADNTWGFSLNSTDFFKIPVNGSPAALKRTYERMTTPNETTAVDFGAKTGMLVSGVYSDKVLFTAYVNGQDGRTLDDMDISEPGHDFEECTDHTTMQCFVCKTDLPDVGSSTTLTDIRDGNTYTVAKLKESQCWMTQNLRIGKTDRAMTLRPTSSDVAEDFVLPASDISSFNLDYDTPAMYMDATYGGYYNYYATSAGTVTSEHQTSEASGSICPKGWRLPMGGLDGAYSEIYMYYDSNAQHVINGLPSLSLGGSIFNGQRTVDGVAGYYWASAGSYDGDAYGGEVNGTEVKVDTYDMRRGHSVRCMQFGY